MSPRFQKLLHFTAKFVPWMAVVAISTQALGAFSPGDVVRLRRPEMLMFKGENFLPAPRDQQFSVFKQEKGKDVVYVAFIQKDGSVIAVTLPESALELLAPDGWSFLQKGMDAFREQRYEDAKKWVAQAAKDDDSKALATNIQARIDAVLSQVNGAYKATKDFAAAVPNPDAESQARANLEMQVTRMKLAQKPFLDAFAKARETAGELEKSGYGSLALGLDDGLDRIAAAVLGKRPPADPATPDPTLSKLDRAQVLARANKAVFSMVRCRQAMAVRRMVEASGYVKEGLAAESAHPGLKALEAKVNEYLKDAEDLYNKALANRQGKNISFGLMSLERGLKTCADYPKLLELRKEMSGAVEAGTAPPVSPEMLSALKAGAPKDVLEQGRTIYTTRCAECHDLYMIESRSASKWKDEVRKMAGKAKLKGNQEELINSYLEGAVAVLGK